MNAHVINVQLDPVDAILEVGLKDLWFPVCPSGFVKDNPMSLRRLGYKIALWRDQAGTLHALEDHCPHRGAPLSMGVILGDRIACPYHGVEVREDGTVTFLENVLEEVIQLFPAKYVHVGGDEAVKDQWEASAREQARMRQVGTYAMPCMSRRAVRPKPSRS